MGFQSMKRSPEPHFEGLENAISLERFANYLRAAEGDRDRALSLYALNTAASNAIAPVLQHLEVALRNAFHQRLSAKYGDDWFDEMGVITDVFQRQKITEAKLDLVKEGKGITPGRVVAAMSFGFWTSCLSARYEDSLWRRGGLSTAFMASGEKPKRNQVNRILTQIRLLRNRIAHYEPILHLNLPKRRVEAIMATRWIAPPLADWAEHHCQFAAIYDEAAARAFFKDA